MTNSPYRATLGPSLAIGGCIVVPATILGTLWGRYGTTVGLTAVAPPVMMLCFVLSRMILVTRPIYPDRKRPWFFVDRLVERSVFGVGSLSEWTAFNPNLGYGDLRGAEDPVDVADSADSPPAEHFSKATNRPEQPVRPVAQQTMSTPASLPVEIEALRPTSPAISEEYVVQRGETYWSLAERLLGDGSRWPDLQQLNLGRAVSPGVVLEEGASLTPGWTILIPVGAKNGS